MNSDISSAFHRQILVYYRTFCAVQRTTAILGDVFGKDGGGGWPPPFVFISRSTGGKYIHNQFKAKTGCG